MSISILSLFALETAISFAGNNNYMNMADPSHAFLTTNETFHTPSLGDEEFEIPPITPPPESEPTLGLTDMVSAFQGLNDPLSSQENEFTPHFPPQSLDLPSITISRSIMDQDGAMLNNGLTVDLVQAQVPQYHHDPNMGMRSVVHMADVNQAGIMQHNQLTTINQSQLSAQLGLNLGGGNVPQNSPSPPASKSATPSPSSSVNDDDAEEFNRVSVEKRAAVDSGKKPKTPKKKKKKDPNEPQKPVSAYALFFRDTQAAIKGQNPNATFGEVSKIVASMWDSLGEEQKQVYKRKTEAAKKEYLKALAAYRASLVSKAAAESAEAQTMRSVQQTLASTSLSTSLLMNSSLSQHASVSVSTQSLQQTLPRAIAPKPMRLSLQGNQLASVPITPNMSTNIATPMGTSIGTTMVPTSPTPQLSPPLQPQQHQMQQMQQHQLQHFQQHHMQQQLHQQIQHQHQIQQHQMQQQQMHHQMQQQQIQQHMQQQLHQQLQQQQIQQQLQQMQLQHMQKQQIQQLQQQQHPPQHSPPQHSPVASQPVVASQITSPLPTRSSPQPVQQQQQSPLQTQAQTQVLPQTFSPPPPEVQPVISSPPPTPVGATTPIRCMRTGCSNPPIPSVEWDNEYCSSECVVNHCRDIFMAWVASRNQSNTASVK
ncbi:TOX high mobility group box family member 3 isoform X2 [Hypanus sabinus]|uniref:TOX high mobility group box family member 3 isoform X2 n=1 Tax=Hypanus sabinus TaxID=79690 RepID=UPI0028C3C542|nr:TOX high mobility group box family member 3 isoform X2 [Hypanus sabinus]